MAWRMVPPNTVLVVFGATGDLAKRKLLPALYHLYLEGMFPERFRVIGSSLDELDHDGFREVVCDAVKTAGRCTVEDEVWSGFAQNLMFVPGSFGPDSHEDIGDAVRVAENKIGRGVQRLFYLAVPPSAFGAITEGLGEADLDDDARVIYEKPFGVDLASFQELDALVHSVLDDEQIYRIDHFLGKESVQNILALRFANGMFEPVWNRQHIDHVQIDVPEALGISQRAGFYEKVGALRDMVVTHLFQVLTFVAMEPPASLETKPLLNEKVKVFDSMAVLSPDDVVRGRFEGYLDVEGVAPDSNTDTFAAARITIDNWRWAGVPFYLRTGKRLARSMQSVTLAFKEPPHRMFGELDSEHFDRDHLMLELGPDEGISVHFLAKRPGPAIALAPARMDFRYESSFGSELIEAYERLLHDALNGDRALFTRGDGIERVWEVVDPVLSDPPPLHDYPAGSWGPAAADALIAPRRWHLNEVSSLPAP